METGISCKFYTRLRLLVVAAHVGIEKCRCVRLKIESQLMSLMFQYTEERGHACTSSKSTKKKQKQNQLK